MNGPYTGCTHRPVADEAVLAFADFDAEAARFAEERAKQRDATDAIRATTAHIRGLNEIARSIGAEPDFTSHGEMFEKEVAKLNAATASQVRNESLRKKFLGQADERTDTFRTRVLANVVRAEFEVARTDIDAALQTQFELYTDAQTQEPLRVQALAQLNDMIALAGARGLFTPQEAEEKRQKFVIGAVREDAALQAARDPRGFLADLRQKNGRYAVLPTEDRVAMARAGASQAIAAALDDDPASVAEIMNDALIAEHLSPEEQDKAREDARVYLEAQAKAKATEDIRAFAAATPALAARANANETFPDISGNPQPAGAPLTVAEVGAMIARLKEGGARPEAVQLHEELHTNLITQGGPKQAAVEPEVFGQLMQAVSDARITPGKRIDVEASMAALVDVQGRVLRAERLGQITAPQAESMLTRVIPAVMAGIERDGVDGAQAQNAIADLYEHGFALISGLLDGRGQETDPAVAGALFSALADRIEEVDPHSLADPETKGQAKQELGRALSQVFDGVGGGQAFDAAAEDPADFDAERLAASNADVDVDETPEQGADEPAGDSLADDLDRLQLALDLAGLTPGVGIAADVVSALISLGRGNLGDAGLSLWAMAPLVGQAAGAAKIARALKKAKGRSGRQARLRELADDPKIGKAFRSWLKQDIELIKRGKRTRIRVPPGTELAHERGREAAKGYSYKHSNLQSKDIHDLQHKYDNFGRKNKERPLR